MLEHVNAMLDGLLHWILAWTFGGYATRMQMMLAWIGIAQALARFA